MERKRALSVALAALMVGSVLTPMLPMLAGLASAQTAEYSHNFTSVGDVRYVGFDTAEMGSGDLTVEISTNDGPGGDHVVLYRDDHTVAGIQDGSTVGVLENAGAYDQITITVSGAPAEPEWGVGSDFGEIQFRQQDQFTSTGGDRDLICDTMERISIAANPAVDVIDCGALPGTRSINETGLDSDQAELEIYKSAAAQKDSSESINTMLENRLQDTETVALIKAKNAYIRSLNSGGSESAAEAAAVSNVTDFYSVMEMNLVERWNAQVANTDYLLGVMENETGVSSSYINASKEDFYDGQTSDIESIKIEGTGTRTVTLQNGTQMQAKTLKLNVTGYGNWMINEIGPMDDKRISATSGYLDGQDSGYTYPGRNATASNLWVQPPETEYEAENFFTMEKFYYRFNEIETQTSSATDQAKTVVNQTYDQYQSGDINTSDLIDPYVLQNEFSSGTEYQGWSAATLSMLGTNQPTDLDATGYMNITLEDGTQLQGIIQSAENPPSGQFSVNETYNPDNIGGSQWITTESTTRELTQNFTVEAVTTTDGESRTNFTIVEKNYETTSTADLAALYGELASLRAELEAREMALADSGGSGLAGIPGLGGLDPGARTVVVVVAGIGLVVLLKD
jgi:hypothetical protein